MSLGLGRIFFLLFDWLEIVMAHKRELTGICVGPVAETASHHPQLW